MHDIPTTGSPKALLLAAALMASVTSLAGCGPSFQELRLEGQRAVAERNWGAARHLFNEAHLKVPEHAENLHDLGVCSMVLARKKFELGNRAAALREADRAVEYFSRSIDAHPGFQPALLGKNRALELKGQFEEALRTAHWAARYVGPSAEQYLFLAAEYEERGDLDGALLRCRQALAIEPYNPAAHKAIGMLHLRAGNRSVAIEALMESLRLDPTQQDVADQLRSMGESVPAVAPDPAD